MTTFQRVGGALALAVIIIGFAVATYTVVFAGLLEEKLSSTPDNVFNDASILSCVSDESVSSVTTDSTDVVACSDLHEESSVMDSLKAAGTYTVGQFMTAAWTETFVTTSVTDSGTTGSGTSMVAPSGTATGDENVTNSTSGGLANVTNTNSTSSRRPPP